MGRGMEHAKSAAAIPRRPSGVEPEGRLRGSGFAERQWLLRRDRQFVQVGDLLYRVVELADGSRTLGEIARELTSSTQWEVTQAASDALRARHAAGEACPARAHQRHQTPALC